MTNRKYRNYLLRTAVVVVMTAGCATGVHQIDSPQPASASASAPTPKSPPTSKPVSGPAPVSTPAAVSAPAPVSTPAPKQATPLPPARAPEPALAPPYVYKYARAANVTYIDEPTLSQRETISWAIGRFAAAGLQLPDLEVSFPASCEGKDAIYHFGELSVDFCRVSRQAVLHEFAHAWDDTSGDVDRAGFLELRDLDVWFGGLDVPLAEQGSEQLAIIIAWGLMDPGAVGAHGLPHNSDAELTEAFVFLTGTTPDSVPGLF
jgi:hypothetical protein